jgi:hypothetical protein
MELCAYGFGYYGAKGSLWAFNELQPSATTTGAVEPENVSCYVHIKGFDCLTSRSLLYFHKKTKAAGSILE